MKYIILAAGKGRTAFSKSENLPKCLLKIENKTIIDYSLDLSKKLGVKELVLVGGFELLKIMKEYTNLKYFYNERWESTKSLYSLYKVFDELNEDCLISYGDIIHKYENMQKIDKNKVNIFYDSQWKTRYENRDIFNLERLLLNKVSMGEFSGLLYVPKSKLEHIKTIVKQILNQNDNSTLGDLVNRISTDNDIKFIDVDGGWTELDSVQDIEHFKFGTKSETLQMLKSRISLATILEQYTFRLNEYWKDPEQIINTIRLKIKSKLLAIRSSALNEDTYISSMAGNYESVLKVEKDNNDAIRNAINRVIQSYTKNNQKQNGDNQVLIQPYLENVSMNGVVFTKDLQTASPYYTISYNKSSDTEAVTSGKSKELSTFICYNKIDMKIEKEEFRFLLKAVKEIEKITNFDAIDVEFAFVEDVLYLLQVRPISANKKTLIISHEDLQNEINNIRDSITNSSPDLLGDMQAFGVMPDWNPAEIIGINPKALSFDLYRYLVTDTVWAKSRRELGYKDVGHAMGLVSLAGKAYVDVKMSFNTFLPASLPKNIAIKLVNFWIEKLKNSPDKHDKVEFDVAITSYDFNFTQTLDELLLNGFSTNEIKEIKNHYMQLTQDIVLEKKISIQNELDQTSILEKRRHLVLESKMSVEDKIYNLLEDCKLYGTLPFAKLARLSFIGSIFLKTLRDSQILSKMEYDAFFTSVSTVAKVFMMDYQQLIRRKLSKEQFLQKYGHLRPGTYDVTSKNYCEGFDDYIDYTNKISSQDKVMEIFYFSQNTKDEISKMLLEENLKISTQELLSFIKRAIEAREKSKFEFTKNLSIVLELIKELGSSCHLSVDDLSYMNLDVILKYKNSSSRIDFFKSIKQNIDNNKQKYLLTAAIKLPELLFEERDIMMFEYPSLKPNFVTQQKFEGLLVYLKNNIEVEIDSKIVFIDNADPGYDWIFSHNIKGLVTKYGGAASHMAIRCAEFDLPAAIGCGEQIFQNLLQYKRILLDSANCQIKGIV